MKEHNPLRTLLQKTGYVQNMISGLKTAFFTTREQNFSGSWHAIAAIMVTFIGAQVLLEFALDGLGGNLTYYWYRYHTTLFTLALTACYLVGSLFCHGERILDLATAFLYSFFFIFVIFAFLSISAENWFTQSGMYRLIKMVIPLWSLLVGIRIASLFITPEKIKSIILAGVIFSAAATLLHSYPIFSRIYYVYSPSEEDNETRLDTLTTEEIFGMQSALRDNALEKISPSAAGQTDIYAISLALYAYQDVFMHDANYATARVREKLGVKNSLKLINNAKTVENTPLANQTNLRFYLDTLAQNFMQPKEDIALLFLTSHGDKKAGLSTELHYNVSLQEFTPERLQQTLRASGIRNWIIIISACHSGTFIPALQDEHTLIITAAHESKASFGCADDAALTYFTEAFFTDGLAQTTDIEKAFNIAKSVVTTREQMQNIKDHSDPQIFVGAKIREVLKKYKAANLIGAE